MAKKNDTSKVVTTETTVPDATKNVDNSRVDLTSNTENDVTRDNGATLSPVHGATNPTLRGENYPQAVRPEVGDFEQRTIGQPRPWEAYQNEMTTAIDKANEVYRQSQGSQDEVKTGVALDSQDPANAGNDGKGGNSETPLLGDEQFNENSDSVLNRHAEEARKDDTPDHGSVEVKRA